MPQKENSVSLEHQQARIALRDLLNRVHAQQPQSNLTPAEQEEVSTHVIKDMRQHDAGKS